MGHVGVGLHEHPQHEAVSLVDDEDAGATSFVHMTADESQRTFIAIGAVARTPPLHACNRCGVDVAVWIRGLDVLEARTRLIHKDVWLGTLESRDQETAGALDKQDILERLFVEEPAEGAKCFLIVPVRNGMVGRHDDHPRYPWLTPHTPTGVKYQTG